MKFTPGKLAGMKAVSDSRGVIAAAAMDQRGSLQKSLGKEKGGEANGKDLEEFKIHVTEVLTQYASAMPPVVVQFAGAIGLDAFMTMVISALSIRFATKTFIVPKSVADQLPGAQR